ncbi:MAG: AI-2E family transporter [Clostridiales bacterium]|jgi:predicted PurR-regulated permease PerM|nr:AI-2E family transporter [Clostridiales bacterium]
MKKLNEKYKLLIFGAVLSAIALNVKDAVNLAGKVMRAFSPVFIGILFSLILNIILNFYERKVFVFKRSGERGKKLKRPLNLFMTYLTFAAVTGGLIALALPHLIKSVSLIADRLPEYAAALSEKLGSFLENLGAGGAATAIIDGLKNSAAGLSDKLILAVPKIVEFSRNIFKGAYDFLMGIALSAFILGCKEKLVFQLKKMLKAFVGEKRADKIFRVVLIANKKLSRFIAGQTFECFIVGIACFIGMTVFKIPYAVLASLIIGITNFIPMIGPLIGTVAAALIIMLDSPVKALYFLIIENVVQQLESTFLYPKVVGGKLGISALWVFASVLVLGNLFGFIGMFLGVPLFACLYAVIGGVINDKLTESKLTEFELPAPDRD